MASRLTHFTRTGFTRRVPSELTSVAGCSGVEGKERARFVCSTGNRAHPCHPSSATLGRRKRQFCTAVVEVCCRRILRILRGFLTNCLNFATRTPVFSSVLLQKSVFLGDSSLLLQQKVAFAPSCATFVVERLHSCRSNFQRAAAWPGVRARIGGVGLRMNRLE